MSLGIRPIFRPLRGLQRAYLRLQARCLFLQFVQIPLRNLKYGLLLIPLRFRVRLTQRRLKRLQAKYERLTLIVKTHQKSLNPSGTGTGDEFVDLLYKGQNTTAHEDADKSKSESI